MQLFKRTFVGVIGCSAVLGAIVFLPWSDGALGVEGQICELGKVPVGTQLRGEVPIRNNGFRVIHVKGIKLGCSCTEASLESEYLPPFTSTKLVVSVKPQEYEKHITTEVALVYECLGVNKAEKECLLQVAGDYEALANTSASTLEFKFESPEAAKQKMETTIVRGALNVAWDDVFLVNPVKNCTVELARINANKFSLSVEAEPDKEIIGSQRSDILLGFSMGKQVIPGYVRVPVIVETRSPWFRANPRQLYYGAVKRGIPVLKRVEFTSLGDAPISLEKVVPSDPAMLDFKVNESRLPNQVSVECVLNPKTSSDFKSEYFEFSIKGGRNQRFRIPVYWTFGKDS